MLRRCLLALSCLAALALPATANAWETPAGATYSQGWVSEADGTHIHYDLLRPKDLPPDAKTPTILSIGPYFGHAGQTGAAGPIEDTVYNPLQAPGFNDRFRDFVDGAKLMQRGYSWIQFDLRGFGESSGCLDWGGPGEQADVKAAVEWTAAQPWSTGKVGMYGKSYDGVTGLIGATSNPKGLAAVVSGEPVYDLYRYLYADGVRYENSLATPALYDAIDATGGPSLLDDPQALLNAAGSPPCWILNYLSQQDDNHTSAYWKARDFVSRGKDVKVPLFLTQGFLENNTKPDGAFDFFDAVSAPKRAWFGMWDHVRGNDVDAAGKLKMGRAGWFDEVMRWFDHYVRDVPLTDAPVDKDPPVVLQTNDGSWRSEQQWPPDDASDVSAALNAGSYPDDAQNAGTSEVAAQGLLATPGNGLWTVSPPLSSAAHLAGIPRISADVGVALPRANLVADVYDIDGKSMATLISRGARRVDASGKVELALYGDDWVLKPGHRIGVLLSGSNMDWWLHLPTLQSVQISNASIRLPFLKYTRSADLAGGTALRLTTYLADAPFPVSAGVIAAATKPDFALPPAQVARPVAAPAKGAPKPPAAVAPRLVARIARKSNTKVVVYGNAPSGYKVAVAVRRGSRTVVARKTTTAKVGAFRVTLTVRPHGRGAVRVRAYVNATKGSTHLKATTALVTLRKR
jgi:predicted acyl esterase